MEPTIKQIEQLKKTELDMLKIFIGICKKENLRYFVIGGTALGAVRHKGFIPWDDDIDVALPRSDYEKFLKIAQLYMPDYLFLQTINNEDNYLNSFAKIRNSKTTFIETSCKDLKMNHGVYLDVFCLDGYPSSKLGRRIFNLKKRIYNLRISLEFYSVNNSSSIKGVKRILLKIIYPDYHKVLNKRERLFKKYDFDLYDYVVNNGGAWGDKEIMPKNYFGSGIEGEFEGVKVILPEATNKYLTHLYGNYMELPPLEKRIGHHYCTVIDLEKPYTEYI